MPRIGILALILAFMFPLGCLSDYTGIDPCEKARDIKKRLCEGYENCYNCICILKGGDWVWAINNFGIPDVLRSYCGHPEPCEGDVLAEAIECLESEESCDPCVYEGIRVCNEPAFVELCP